MVGTSNESDPGMAIDISADILHAVQSVRQNVVNSGGGRSLGCWASERQGGNFQLGSQLGPYLPMKHGL